MLFVSVRYTVRSGNTVAVGFQPVFIEEMTEEPTFDEWDDFEQLVTKAVIRHHHADSASVDILGYKKMREQ